MTLRIIGCNATPSSIKVFFSDEVNAANSNAQDDATNKSNYQLVARGATTTLSDQNSGTITYHRFRHAVDIPLAGPDIKLNKDDFIAVIVSNVRTATGDQLPLVLGAADRHVDQIGTRVNGEDDTASNVEKTTRAAEDAVTYPLLTEEVSSAPPSARPPGGTSGGSGAGSLTQVVTQAVGDVLGWKVKATDAKGFVGALNASFALKTVEGHTEAVWTPRTYAVQTDLSGGITGAQASLYTRAQRSLEQSLPLLDGLYSLDLDADAEDVAALKAVARSQLTELVKELALPGGPRVDRVNQYFQLLLNRAGAHFPPTTLEADPDQIEGTLGKLRNQLGLNTSQDFVNTIEEEQDLSNFRILSDYVTSLAQSWINNLDFFGLDAPSPFLGTQLVHLSRQLSVVAESVDEVRFTLDSVFIGPAERHTLQLNFGPNDQPLFAEDLFNWISDFATNEGPRLIQDGGKFGVHESFLPIARRLQHFVRTVQDPNPRNRNLPRGFHTSRVQRALSQLAQELGELVRLASQISHAIVERPTIRDINGIRESIALLEARQNDSDFETPVNIVAFPPLLTFPPQRVGTASHSQTVTLFNSGSSRLDIKSIKAVILDDDEPDPDQLSPEFFVVDLPALPIRLAPQTTLPLLVAFKPAAGNGPAHREAALLIYTEPRPVEGAGPEYLEIRLSGKMKRRS
jgi:hypothetical protein